VAGTGVADDVVVSTRAWSLAARERNRAGAALTIRGNTAYPAGDMPTVPCLAWRRRALGRTL
jgi:hypothetical protein